MRRVRSALPWKAHVFMTIIALLSTAADVAHSFTITFDTASTTKVLFYQPSMETYEIQPGYLFQMSAVDPDRKNSTQIVSIHADRFFSKDVPSRNFSVYMFTYDLFPKTSLYISVRSCFRRSTLRNALAARVLSMQPLSPHRPASIRRTTRCLPSRMALQTYKKALSICAR